MRSKSLQVGLSTFIECQHLTKSIPKNLGTEKIT